MRSTIRSILATVGIAALFACSGEEISPPAFDVTTPRALVPPDVDAAAISPAAPGAAALPVFASCPEGWSQAQVAAGVTACEPWAANARPTCAADQIATPSHPSCAAIGSACAGDFALSLPSTGVLYVRPGALAGDGSLLAPFGTLAAALAVATAGSTIALGRGTFVETAVITTPVSIVGACATETIIRTELPQTVDIAALEARAPATFTNLTITTTARWAVLARGAAVHLRGAKIDGGRLGLTASEGGRLIVEGVRFTGVGGTALSVTDGRADLTRVSIEGSLFGATVIGASSHADLDDIAIVGCGSGLMVSGGGSARLTRAAIEGWDDVAVGVSEVGSSAVVEEAVIRGAIGTGDGLATREGGQLTASRVVVSGPGRSGASADAAGSSIEVRDLIVLDPTGDPEHLDDAYGLFVSGGAIAGTRVLVRGAVTGALIFLGSASAELTDLTVEAGRAAAAGELGIGVDVQQDATAHLARVQLAGNHSSGLSVTRGAHATVEDATVIGTEPGNTALGFGVIVGDGAELDLQRARLERNSGVAFAITDGGKATIQDLAIVGTVTPFVDRMLTAFLGVGMAVLMGGEVDGTRIAIENNRDAGLVIENGSASFDGLAIRSTFGDGGLIPGYGIRADRARALTISHAIIEGNAHDAIRMEGMLGEGATMATLSLSDAFLRGGGEALSGMAHGLLVSGNVSGTVERVAVEQPTFAGIRIAADTSLVVLRDVSITDVAAGRAEAMTRPRGALILDGAKVQIDGLAIQSAVIAGVLLNGSADVAATDVTVESISAECAGCAAAGIVAFPESRGTFERFEVRSAELAGAQFLGGDLHLTNGVIASSGIGIHHWSWVDAEAAMDRVRLEENRVDFDQSGVAVPEWPSN